MNQLGDWTTEGNDWVYTDPSGIELRTPRNRLPDGSFMETFAGYTVDLERDYPAENLSDGDEAIVQEVPGGKLKLIGSDGLVFDEDAEPTVDFAMRNPAVMAFPGTNATEFSLRQGVDLIQEMIDADPPIEIDWDEAKTRVFLDDRETNSADGCVCIHDPSLYAKALDPEELLLLVERQEIPGVEISGQTVVELVKIAFDSYAQNRFGATDEDRNRLAQRIYDLLEPIRLI